MDRVALFGVLGALMVGGACAAERSLTEDGSSGGQEEGRLSVWDGDLVLSFDYEIRASPLSIRGGLNARRLTISNTGDDLFEGFASSGCMFEFAAYSTRERSGAALWSSEPVASGVCYSNRIPVSVPPGGDQTWELGTLSRPGQLVVNLDSLVTLGGVGTYYLTAAVVLRGSGIRTRPYPAGEVVVE